jgi:hypothetical protein
MDIFIIPEFKGSISLAYIFYRTISDDSRYLLLLLNVSENKILHFSLCFIKLVILNHVFHLVPLNTTETVRLYLPKYLKLAKFCFNFSILFWFWLFYFPDSNFALLLLHLHIGPCLQNYTFHYTSK